MSTAVERRAGGGVADESGSGPMEEEARRPPAGHMDAVQVGEERAPAGGDSMDANGRSQSRRDEGQIAIGGNNAALEGHADGGGRGAATIMWAPVWGSGSDDDRVVIDGSAKTPTAGANNGTAAPLAPAHIGCPAPPLGGDGASDHMEQQGEDVLNVPSSPHLDEPRTGPTSGDETAAATAGGDSRSPPAAGGGRGGAVSLVPRGEVTGAPRSPRTPTKRAVPLHRELAALYEPNALTSRPRVVSKPGTHNTIATSLSADESSSG
jgi:hypothetical protein